MRVDGGYERKRGGGLKKMAHRVQAHHILERSSMDSNELILRLYAT
jgi:hypothetical protein